MESTGRAEHGEPEAKPDGLPDFLIIGIMKSGSTTLHRWLGEHPDVWFARPKEPEFFSHDHHWSQGLDWYRALFQGAPTGRLKGEASMSYTKPPTAEVSAQRIADTLPGVEMIAILRQPVERIRSHYRHEIQKGREDRPLVEALRDPGTFYLAQSCYHQVLRPYLDRFTAEQLLIVRFDDLVGDDPSAWNAVLDHLGLRRVARPLGAYNVTATKPRDSKLFRRLADRGLLKRKQVVPERVRRAVRPLLHTEPDDPVYQRQLAESGADIPADLLAPMWQDVAELEQALGRELWEPEDALSP